MAEAPPRSCLFAGILIGAEAAAAVWVVAGSRELRRRRSGCSGFGRGAKTVLASVGRFQIGALIVWLGTDLVRVG
jgi:hypothetical protein